MFFKIIITMVMLPFHYMLWDWDANREQQTLIEKSINHSANACEDFYSFACGNYADSNTNIHYQEITGYMDYQYNKRLLNLMETMYQHDHHIPDQSQTFVMKSKVYLMACCRETQRRLEKYFENIKPGPQLNWPILENATENDFTLNYWQNDSDFDLWVLLGQLQSYGLNNVLVNQEILMDENSAISIMMEPAFIENNTTLPDTTVLYVMLKGLGISSNIRPIVRSLKVTDKKIIDILQNFRESEDNLELTYDKLEKRFPNLNLKLYISHLLGQDLQKDALIIFRNPKYFQYLNDNMWLSFQRKELCNYLMIKFLFFLMVDSAPELTKLGCVKDLRNKMDLAVNYLYYHHIYRDNTKSIEDEIRSLTQQITNSFYHYFQQNHLKLTELQMQKLIDKLNKIRLNIGNLPENPTLEKIEKFYANIPALDKENYYRNHLLLLQHRFRTALHYAHNQTYFIVADNRMGSLSGAVYVNQQNMIIIPFGSLQYPLFDVRFSDLYKYSLLGFILAHEYTHAFETTGLNFNSLGQPTVGNSDILESENFLHSQDCLQAQLATDSIDERIADIVAIRVVYKAFTSKLAESKPTFLPLDWKKVFFLNLAQFFCGKNNIKFTDHDSDSLRLNQIVMNSAAFAQAFECPENSPMNPGHKCRLY